MKAMQLKQTNSTPFLKVINNTLTKASTITTEQVKRIYINTLMPDFKYINQLGEVVRPQKCILL